MVFLGVVLFPCLIKNFSPKSNCGKLVLGLLLSYCSRFCNLIALLWAPKTNSMEALRGLSIWDKITSPEIMWGFIIVLFFISSVRVYQGKRGYHNQKNFGEAAKRVGHRPCSFSCPKYRVSVQGVESLGGHFATLCRGFDFYEVKKKREILLHF